ncbi:MAG: prephenate dehydratase [Ktedonobacteraceae bacterium]|nr:prephenate dehydratase [Ktedonobacteraceae bacterium]
MISVAFQGEQGAFGDEAAQAYFGQQEEAAYRSYHSFSDVFSAVGTGEVDYGIVPLENSQAGSINEVYDLLFRHSLFVIGEISHPVHHCLLCLPGQQLSDIKRVISHSQALAQCDEYLQALSVETIATYNTAGSARMIQEQHLQGIAAVASATAARLYGLQILAREIQTIKDNYTRFIALGREPANRCSGSAKTMLALATLHQPGSLYRCLGVLANQRINLLKLESRPSRQRPWEYIFFLDVEGHHEDSVLQRALADLEEYTTFCKMLGSFTRTVA